MSRPFRSHRRPSFPRTPSLLVAVPALILCLSSGCATGSIPWRGALDGAVDPEARKLLQETVEAHGGDAWAEVTDVTVRYEGSWGKIVPKMQPVLSDHEFRSASTERYWPGEGVVTQDHRGPAGEKRVLRDPDSVSVTYREEGRESFEPANDEQEAAAALVADAYTLFLFGPSFVAHRADRLERLPPKKLDGRSYLRLLASLRPGFGFSEEDRVVLFIDDATRRLYRVLFSLEGFESTRGAEVDVTFLSYREQDGYLWPEHFRERVRAPVRAFAHVWTTEALEVNSGARPAGEPWLRGASEPAPLGEAEAEPGPARDG